MAVTKTRTVLRNKKKHHRKEEEIDTDNLEEIERQWELPNFTIKEIRDAIPAHCFHRDTFRSFSYVFHDIFLMFILAYAASYIDTIPSIMARIILWPLYWICQGIVSTGIWVIGHECGHQAFSPSKTINNIVGIILHSILLVPFHSWRISHSKHHKGTGHMKKDQVFVPATRSERNLPPRHLDPEGDGPHSAYAESPLGILYGMIIVFILGWPMYLMINFGGQPYAGWVSHFNPYCAIFDDSQFWDVMQSAAGVSVMIGILAYLGQQFGSLMVIKYYVIPYLFVNFWLVLITYLQHTHPDLPHYRENVWNFQRGACLTIDRSYGILNHFHHHISDTHVVHHFFSTMPHYHAVEATHHIKKALGKHYFSDHTPIFTALLQVWRECRFVEDEGDVIFYKR